MSFLNFIEIEDDLCLVMNNDFIKNIDKLKEITTKLESNEWFSLKINPYEALKMFDTFWIKQQFYCEKSFIEWLKHAVRCNYFDYLNNLKTIEYKGKNILVMTGFEPCKDNNNNLIIKPPNVKVCESFYHFLQFN